MNTTNNAYTNSNVYANNNNYLNHYPNNYPNNYPMNNNYPPNYNVPPAYPYPTYPNPPQNQVNYVPMPTHNIALDTTQRNLVINV